MLEIRYQRQNPIIFYAEKFPSCNLCGVALAATSHTSKSGSVYHLLKNCANADCDSTKKTLTPRERYKAFLPELVHTPLLEKIDAELRQRNRYCVEYWMAKGLTLEEAKEKISANQKVNISFLKPENRAKITKEFYRSRGLSEDEVKRKTLTPTQKEFWSNKGLSESDALEKIKAHQQHAGSFVDYDKRLLPSNAEYWQNKGFSESESKNMVSERQKTFSLKKCIEKFGEEKGLVRFNKRQATWQKNLLAGGNMKCGYSKISQELFDKLKNHYTNTNDVRYATHGKELGLCENGKNYLYDFVDTVQLKIIEYNGDQYHANPTKYAADSKPHPYKNKLASTIWNEDIDKFIAAESRGYEYLVIWDSDYKKDKQTVLEKCLKFLNK